MVLLLGTRVTANRATISPADTMAEPTRHDLETLVTNAERLTTNAVSTWGEPSQPGDLRVSGETAATAVVEETSSSIDDMIKELSQVRCSEVPLIEAGGSSTSAGDMAEELSQAKKSHERVTSPTPQSGEI